MNLDLLYDLERYLKDRLDELEGDEHYHCQSGCSHHSLVVMEYEKVQDFLKRLFA